MKKLISVIIIGVFLIAMCILEEILVNNTLSKIDDKGKQIYALAQTVDNLNYEPLLNQARELSDFWESREEFLCFFVNHKDMHDMGKEITNMISYAKRNSAEDFYTSLELVIYYSTTLHHLMGVSLQNIF